MQFVPFDSDGRSVSTDNLSPRICPRESPRIGKGDKDCLGRRLSAPSPYTGCRGQAVSRPAAEFGCVTMLPKSLWAEVAGQVEIARSVWHKDCLSRLLRLPRPSGSPAGWLSHAKPLAFGWEEGLAGVYMPGALSRKFRRAAESFEWF